MARINRKKFYDTYKAHFGRLKQEQVNAINFLLEKLEIGRFKLETQMAYILASVKHETADTFEPVVEGYWIKSNRELKLFNYYKQHNRGALATIFPNGSLSGKTYEGRGYIQLTHNFNYEKFGLLDCPSLALQPETAFMIMEKGLANGMFTGKSLQQYVNEEKTDYYNARKTINGLDRSSLIAGYAKTFENAIELVAEETAMQGYDVADVLA